MSVTIREQMAFQTPFSSRVPGLKGNMLGNDCLSFKKYWMAIFIVDPV